MSAEKTQHIPYARMKCPIEGCTSLRGGPQEGTVPGIKRHVLLVHGEKEFKKVEWPPIRTAKAAKEAAKAAHPAKGGKAKDELATMPVAELRAIAKKKGVDPMGLRKAELIDALSS